MVARRGGSSGGTNIFRAAAPPHVIAPRAVARICACINKRAACATRLLANLHFSTLIIGGILKDTPWP